MVGSVLYGADDAVIQYVRSRLCGTNFGPATALGIVKNGKLIGGVVFHEHRPLIDVHASYALESGPFYPWRQLFAYPFDELKVVRVTAIINKKHRRACELAERLGFKMEGTHPRAFDGRDASVSYGMLRENCRWIRKQDNGPR